MRARRPRFQERQVPKHKHTINEHIRATELRVIGSDGENFGVISRSEALTRAQEEGLDLVMISKADADVVVAKIMDFGKFLYEKKKQENKAKKQQKVIQVKEVKFRPNIGDQDYHIKVKRAGEFLTDGKRVKCTLQFRRGRELATMAQVGAAMFERITTDLNALSLGTLLEEKEQRGRIMWSKVYYLKGK